jgi:uncharacterized protein YgiM (DUF1202 family)
VPVSAQTSQSGAVTAERLNVRQTPATSGTILAKLVRGDTVTILASSDDGLWYQITSVALSGEGWVFAQFITISGGAEPVAAEATTEPLPAAGNTAPAAGVTAVTTPGKMNLRGGPGTGYNIVASLAAGTRLAVTGINGGGDWLQVDAPNANGWVLKSLTTVAGDLSTVPVAEAPAAPAAAPPATGAPVAAAAVVPAGQPSTGFGYGITVNTWQGDKQGAADRVRELGFNWVKQQIRWEYAEPEPGNIQWAEMDGIAGTFANNGISVMFSVVTSPGWTRPNLGGTGGPPEDFQLFANFLGAVAGRYCGQVQAIEVWNEQNLRREWEGFPLEPASYMELLKRAYGSIKANCPQMLVISGATTPAGYSDVAFDDVDYLRGMYQNGLANYSDGVGIHPSGFANPPSVTFEDWAGGNYDALSHVNHRSFYFLSTLRESRAVMEQFGDYDAKLWPTEFGWGSTPSPFPGYEYEARIDEATQGRWIVDAFNIMAGSGYVGGAMLWNLNYPRDTEMGAFAVVNRPAFDALKRMMGR